MKYDYLIVGSGLFGSVFAYEANKRGYNCLVIEKRNHIGGNVYTERQEEINVHKYGAHIFHTSSHEVWNYIQQFAEFNRFINSPVARYKDEIYSMPFNMNTFNKLWGVITPQQAKEKINTQIKEANVKTIRNLQDQALSLVGKDIYEKLIKGYTQKQWGKPCTELPSFIIKRIPIRFTYDNNYFNDLYQGIPVGGYTQIFERLLDKIEVKLNCDFFEKREEYLSIAKKIVFTGMIDQYYDYCFGNLEYRSLRFESELMNTNNFQGNAVVNYNEYEIPYTRIIEHKHFEFGTQSKTLVTKEYPSMWKKGDEPYYPINDEKNNRLFRKYETLAIQEENVIFGGRLGMYKYYDMHNVIAEALRTVKREFD